MPQSPSGVSVTAPSEFAPKLEFAFDIRLEFHDRQRFGPTYSGGMIGFVGISGGTVEGPRLNGRIVPFSGGDWAQMRPDGVVEFCAHYLIEASDGTLIHIHNRGFGRAKAKALAKGQAFDEGELAEHYFRVTPRFDTVVGPHDWLTRHVIVGFGERKKGPDRPDSNVIHYYTVL